MECTVRGNGARGHKWNFHHVLEQKLSPVPVFGDCVPNVPRFYGRSKELADLEATVNHHRCVVLVGPPGIGKTALTVKLLGSLSAHEWDCVIWKSAYPVPQLETLVKELLALLSPLTRIEAEDGKVEDERADGGEPQINTASQRSEDLISQLLERLQSHRYLIVLDSAEMLRGHQEYQPFFRRVVGAPHRSCFY